MELQNISSKIYEIRGIKVLLDFDLALLYEVETKVLKQAVRRNLDRFPADFMFELTIEEFRSLRSQIVTLENGKGQHSKYLPFAFTEQGVAMLSGVLKSSRAVAVNISIMRTFIYIRQFALSHAELTKKLQELEGRFNQKFNHISEAIDYLLQKDQQQIQQGNRKRIGF